VNQPKPDGQSGKHADRRGRLSGWEIWRWPIVLALLTGAGLAAALLADGVGDVVGWLALVVPVVLGAGALARAWGSTPRASSLRRR
jgi:hypothetical protein